MKKQIIAVLFVLLVLFFAGNASAEDNQTADANLMDGLSANAVSVAGDTFDDIGNAISAATPGSTINLGNKTFTGDSEIVISKDITIDGSSLDNPDSVSVLDAQKLTRIFKIDGPYTVTLKNLVLINGLATEGSETNLAAGAAVYGYMDKTNDIIKLTLDNVLFENNTALEGGAVYIRGRSSEPTSICQVNANNCNFINNRASNGAGAIYVYNTNVFVNNCSFIDNTALRTNSSGYSGGAIFNYGTLRVNNSLFENNTGLFGGAIVNDQKSAVITNSKFLANIATTNSGSAIYNYDSFATLVVDNCTFSYNVANRKGSGIYNYRGTANISNSYFDNNTARSSALLFNDGGKMNIANSNFTGNVGESGSVIYNQNCTMYGVVTDVGVLTINGSNFDFNIPLNGTEIYNSAVLKLYSSKLNGNYTLLQNYGTLTLEDNEMASDKYLNIYNDGGVFVNPIRAVVLDNSTVKAYIDENVPVSAILLDLDDNTIGDTSFRLLADGKEVNPLLYKNGTYKENMTFSKSGIYPVSASVDSNGDRLILEKGTVEILPRPELNVSADNITYPESANIDVSSSNLTDDEIKVIVKNAKTNETVFNGSVSVNNRLNLPNLNAGNYSVAVSFAGNDKYSPVNATTAFEVKKADVELTVRADDISYGESAVCDVTLGDVTGPVDITINGEQYTVDLVDGKGSVTVPGLNAGDYNITASFAGNDNYNPASANSSFNVAKIKPKLVIVIDNITYGDVAVANVYLNDRIVARTFVRLASAGSEYVNVTVDGKTYEVPISNGFGSQDIPGLAPGTYEGKAAYAGDENYLPAENSTTFTVTPFNITVSHIVITQGSNGTVDITLAHSAAPLTDPIKTNVVVSFNGKDYVVECINGKGVFSVPNDLAAGYYPVLVSLNNEIGVGSVKVLPLSNSTNGTENDTGNDNSSTSNTNNANNALNTGLKTNLGSLKTGNPILLLALAAFLIPLRRKFNR